MKRIPSTVAAVLVASMFLAGGAWAFGTKDVIQMHRDGIPDSLIIQKIEHSGKNFDLDARDMRDLRDAGVSDEIISAMLATEDQGRGDYGYPVYTYPYYYPYYHPYYYPRFSVGLGFNYCYRPYGYYRPYYRYGYSSPWGSGFSPARHGFGHGYAPSRVPSIRHR